MLESQIILLIIIALLNIYSFSLFYRDKQYARTNRFRISERRLIMASFLLGGVGAFVAMRRVRHKTQHLKFQLLVPLAAVITLLVSGWVSFSLWNRL